jgi:hypothetical protein
VQAAGRLGPGRAAEWARGWPGARVG